MDIYMFENLESVNVSMYQSSFFKTLQGVSLMLLYQLLQ